MSGSTLFEMNDTHGVPLEIGIIYCMERKLLIDWRSYVESGRKAGWKLDKIIGKMVYACRDTGYGGKWIKENFEYIGKLEITPNKI